MAMPVDTGAWRGPSPSIKQAASFNEISAPSESLSGQKGRSVSRAFSTVPEDFLAVNLSDVLFFPLRFKSFRVLVMLPNPFEARVWRSWRTAHKSSPSEEVLSEGIWLLTPLKFACTAPLVSEIDFNASLRPLPPPPPPSSPPLTPSRILL